MNKWFIGLHTKKSEYHVQLEKKNTEMENLPVETTIITYKKNLSHKRRSYNIFIPNTHTKKKAIPEIKPNLYRTTISTHNFCGIAYCKAKKEDKNTSNTISNPAPTKPKSHHKNQWPQTLQILDSKLTSTLKKFRKKEYSQYIYLVML